MTNELTNTGLDDEAALSPELDAYLRADAIVDAINANLPKGKVALPKIPKGYVFRKRDREAVSAAFHGAFELSGGTAALTQWAANNPDKFYPLLAKFAQAEAQVTGGSTFVFQTSVPSNNLDLTNVDAQGNVQQLKSVDFKDADE